MTVISPEVAPVVTVMLLVPWPAVMVQSAGTLQVYVVPGTSVTEYTSPVVPSHGVVFPVIAEGWAGGDIGVTASVWGVPLPQRLLGVTVMFPASAPASAVMLFVP